MSYNVAAKKKKKRFDEENNLFNPRKTVPFI